VRAVPALGVAVPRRGNRFTRAVGRSVLAAMGWRLEIEFPDAPKFVVIVAPHTSAWDFVFAITVTVAMGLRASWMGKSALFRWPFGGLMRWLGGIPIDRRASHGVVETMVELFKIRPHLVLGIAPEGTRRKVGAWKTGFYHIAHGAGVPIVPCYVDYARKVIGSGATVHATGDLAADLRAIQSIYAGVTGKHPAAV
jgi:1-acyl-sn-glycerol-3-phosphate acyltransferase